MPGNDVGDRVHNFFPQENLSQGQHHPQIVDGNWPVVNNLWVGSPGQVGVLNSNVKGYNLQHSDAERGQSSHPLHGPHGLNLAQSSPRPEVAKNQSQSQQLNLNGYMYGNRFNQTRQNETNFLAVDTASDQHNSVSRGLSMYELHQGSVPQQQTKSLVRSETSESPVSFDLFGNQQPMNHPQSSMLQSLHRQQSGFNNMRQQQQQHMLRKMQELQRQQQLQLDARQQLQRQQQLRQLDARQQNAVNHISPFGKQFTGSYPSPMINGSSSSDSLTNPSGIEIGNMNWLQRASPVMEGSSNGLVFSPNVGQAHRLMDLVPQQGDQSLYGVPVSSSRGNVSQFSQVAAEKPSMQHMTAFGSSLPDNQYMRLAEQASMQDDSLIPRQRFPSENLFGHSSGQAVTPAMNMESLQEVSPMQRNESSLEIQGRQELAAQEERTSGQVATSQNEVSLDPTEERILFGSDDNIWAAFGKNSNMIGDACSPYDGDGPNGFSSFQSGTWSALMQSAVAETSSGDIGQQEEWSGLNFQHTVVPPGNQRSSYSEKQQTSFRNDIPSSLNSSVLPPDNSSMNNNYQNALGFHQPGNKFACDPDQRLQANSSQRLVSPSEGASRWSNSGLAELSSLHGNALHSLDAETNMKSISGPWTAVQSGMIGQQYGKPNGWNALGSVTPFGDAAPSMHESENSSRHSQGSEPKGVMQGEVVHGSSPWSSHGMPSEVEHGKSFVGNLHVNRDGFNVSNAAATPNPSATRSNEGTSVHPFNNYQLNYWKNVNPTVKAQASENVERSNQLVDKGHQAVDSSLNSCNKVEVKKNEMENYNRRENSSDSHRSNLSRHNSAGALKENGGLKENVFSDVSDSRSLPSGKQKSVNQINRKNSGPRKFHYHPMGNLDEEVEPSGGMKQPSHSLAMPLQSTHFGQAKSFGQIPKSSMELAKEQSTEPNGAEGIDDMPSRRSLPGQIQNATMPFNRSVDVYPTSKDSQLSSQNMLELLHKVDQSRDHSPVMHYSSSGRKLSSEKPEAENSDGSEGRLQQSQSSASQGFGLQLGPPSQRSAVANQSHSSQSHLQMPNALHQSQTTWQHRGKGQTQFAPTSSVQSLPPSSEKPLGELKNNRSGLPGLAGNNAFMHKLPGNFSSAFNSGFPYSRSQSQYQQRERTCGQDPKNQYDASNPTQIVESLSGPSTGQAAITSLPDAAGNAQNVVSGSLGGSSQQTGIYDAHAQGSVPQAPVREPVPVSQPFSVSGISQQGTSSKMLTNMWTSVPGHPQLSGPQFHKISSHVPQLHQPKVLESTSYAIHKQGDQDVKTGRNVPSELSGSSMNEESPSHRVSNRNIAAAHKMDDPQGAEPVPSNISDGSPANSASMRQDLEAFGRSLKSNKFSHQNYSLLNQVRVMKSTESDPNDILKKMKVPESSGEGQQVAPTPAQSSENSTPVALVHHSAVLSGDSKMLSFSESAANEERKASTQHGNVASHNMLDFSQDDSPSNPHGNNSVSVRVERPQVSPQMAPSWFSQYGSFRNGQILAVHDPRRAPITNTAEWPPSFGKSSSGFNTLNMMEQVNAAVDTGRTGNIQPSSTPVSVTGEHISSLQSPALNVVTPKKRKRATSQLTPWHKEVSQGSLCLQTISMSEMHWAKATNRLTEKIEDEVELIEDVSPMLRAKRRLTLTTQLMQQLLRPPKSVFLYADATSHTENVTYSLSRLVLGDACYLVSHPSSEPDMPQYGVNLLSDKCKRLESVNDRHLFKAVEDFMERARKLESDFLRMEKRASVLDLRVECQELEKFSVINRFAKFHGRGQAESGDTSSSSDGAANVLKPGQQRYVTALPLPRNLPDRVQCLSL